MKFSLISDMHVDFPQPKTPYEKLEKVVVVAGDTSNGLEGLKFLQKMRNKGFEVLACPGNHENYANISTGRDIMETEARFREEYPAEVEVEGVPFILKTGWYQVRDEHQWQGYMNDSRRMVVSADKMNMLARRDTMLIRQTLKQWKDYQKKGVVVTHMSPCLETLNPRFAGHYSNDWYWNPLLRELLVQYKDQILVWCHGHTHAAADVVVEGVRVVCNPRGYPGENENWEPWTIEV